MRILLSVLSVPDDVTVTNITSRAVLITWSPPTGVVQSYLINITDNSGVDDPRIVRINGGNVSSYSVDTLTPFTEYSLTLHAVSPAIVGEINETPTIFRTLEDSEYCIFLRKYHSLSSICSSFSCKESGGD